MEKEDLKYNFLANLPVNIEGIGNLYSLKLKEIIEMGYSKYNQILCFLCCEPEDVINEEEIDNKKITTFDIIYNNCSFDKEFKKLVLYGFSMFFHEEINMLDEYNLFYLGDINNGRFIYKDNYEEIKRVLKLQNYIPDKKEEFNPANEKAKKLMEKIKKNRKKNNVVKKDNSSELYNIISGVAWKSHIGISSVWDLTIYQLYDAYTRLDLIDNRDKTLNGIYAGTVDREKIDLNDLSWIKEIKINN